MAGQCVVCGRDIDEGLACERCSADSGGKQSVAIPSDPLPPTAKAASDVLRAAGVPFLIITSSKTVRSVSEEVRNLLGIDSEERNVSLRKLESRLGTRLPPLDELFSTRLTFGSSHIDVTMVPLAAGAEGAALILQCDFPQDGARRGSSDEILATLRALREALSAAGRYRAENPLLDDTADTVDRIVSALDAPPPKEDWTSTQPHKLPGSISQVVRQAAARYMPIAELKDVQFHVDLPELQDLVRDAADLEDALEILLENAIHYVPRGGQLFVGARTTERKGKPIALFFVMDNGPCVPDELKEEIFTPRFQWDSSREERTGRNLSFCHTLAARHGGQCWVDSKPGRSCTFFLSMRTI